MKRIPPWDEYDQARREHVWWLRERGVTYTEIARRLGFTSVRGQQIAHYEFRRRYPWGKRPVPPKALKQHFPVSYWEFVDK
jgi:hypothetical protein